MSGHASKAHAVLHQPSLHAVKSSPHALSASRPITPGTPVIPHFVNTGSESGGDPTPTSSTFLEDLAQDLIPIGSGAASPASLKDPLLHMNEMQLGAMMIHEAINLRHFNRFPQQPRVWHAYKSYHRITGVSYWAIGFLLLLTIFETPLWCRGGGRWDYRATQESCAKNNGLPVDQVIMSGVPFLPIGLGLLLELILLCVVFAQVLISWKLDAFFKRVDNHGYLPKSEIMTMQIMLASAFVDVMYYALCPDTTFRIAPLVRFGLGTTIPWIHNILSSFLRVIGAIWKVGFMLACTILVFAWIGAMLFADLDMKDRYGEPVNLGFESFSASVYTMFVTMTTSNMPDVMIASYLYNPFFLFYWVPFLTIAVLFFAQVILASVYSEYREQVTHFMKVGHKNRNKGISDTFEILKESSRCHKSGQERHVVAYPAFEQLTEVLWQISTPRVLVPKDAVSIIYQALDDDGNNLITKDEFFDMCDLMHMQFLIHPRDSPIRRWLGNSKMYEYLKSLMDNGKTKIDMGYQSSYPGSVLDKFIGSVLTMNVIWIVFESVLELNRIKLWWLTPMMLECVDLFFTFVYLLEVMMKLSWYSWTEYSSMPDNKFDFFTTMVLTMSGILYVTKALQCRAAIRYLNMLRLVRLLKGLAQIPTFSTTCKIIERMFSTCADVLAMNYLVIYLWSSFGVLIFGGRLYSSNPVFEGNAQPYFDSHYSVYNFNDMILAMVSCFFAMLGTWNDTFVTVCMALHERGTVMWYLAGTFWFAFYVASPLIAFNVFTAFSIDVYQHLADKSDKDTDPAALAEGLLNEVQRNIAAVREEYATSEPAFCLHARETPDLARALFFRELFDDDDSDDKQSRDDDMENEEQVLGPTQHFC